MRISTESFSEAQKNMDFDSRLVQGLDDGEAVLRAYLWKRSGITYGYKQEIPEDLKSLDRGRRETGGGIVFHSPGDVVFSLSGFLDDARFPGSLKDKLGQVQGLVRETFRALEIELQGSSGEGEVDYAYCASYPNPFELYYRGEKVLALTMRRYLDRFLIQGILHLGGEGKIFSEFQNKEIQKLLIDAFSV